ncbi:MAG: hypothetical protein GXP32_08600 [Kiritimatiellaeota bacterium]|nr:hypothetical protein [Kiritimatiellota bacterium]
MLTYFNNGRLFNQMDFEQNHPANGVFWWFNGEHKIIAKCRYKNGKPYEGVELTQPRLLMLNEPGDLPGYLYDFDSVVDNYFLMNYYKRGKLVESKKIHISKNGRIVTRKKLPQTQKTHPLKNPTDLR